MEAFQRVQGYELLKTLADARRLNILRRLMLRPATLSQLGQELGEHPARIRHHVKVLENAGLVELTSTRAVRGFIEKYYRAKAQVFWLQELILPYYADCQVIPLLGSHDLALELLGEQVRQTSRGELELASAPVGSLDGLIALRQGIAQLAGCHLWDAASGEYNLPYLHRLFPDREMKLFTVAHRTQGLLVAPGNPFGIHALSDLTRPGFCMVNRNPGSGTRLWLDHQLHKLGLEITQIAGYAWQVRTHTEVAQQVALGKAQAGLGLQAVAAQYRLDFIPLFQERFDLAVSAQQVCEPVVQQVLHQLCSRVFRQQVGQLAGYDATHTGEQISAGYA